MMSVWWRRWPTSQGSRLDELIFVVARRETRCHFKRSVGEGAPTGMHPLLVVDVPALDLYEASKNSFSMAVQPLDRRARLKTFDATGAASEATLQPVAPENHTEGDEGGCEAPVRHRYYGPVLFALLGLGTRHLNT